MIMRDLQRDLGLTQEQAAGLVGNLGYESAGFKAYRKASRSAEQAGSAMRNGPDRGGRKFMRYAQSRGLDPKSHEANVGFLKHELTATTRGFCTGSNRPRACRRARLTHEVYELRPTCSRNIGGNTSRTRPRPGDCDTLGAPTPWAAEPEVASAATEPARGAPQPAAAATTASAARAAPDRAELEKPIPLRFEHQPGETQMRRTSIAREVDRSVREATLNSYADSGFA